MFGKKENICVIAGRECPKTNDPSQAYYCNHWVNNIPETQADGSGRFTHGSFTGCFITRLPEYLVVVAATAGHAAASADKAATVAQRSGNIASTLIQMVSGESPISSGAIEGSTRQ